MAPRPHWKGYLKLSLVSCPIGLYPAVSAAEKIAFRQVNRETGHRLLMEALARRGNVAEALRAYERLRVLLREELGITPSPTVQGVHRRLLENAGS